MILCGGAGTRLWPVSRQTYPKQLLPVIGEKSLLQQTAARLSGEHFAPAIVVSGEDQRLFIKRQLEAVGADVEAILLEPEARNTAPAAALAAAWLQSKGHDDLMLLMPSDHVIGDREAFVRATEIGAPHAENGAIVTFGATPTEPNVQYGYIEADIARGSDDGAFPIARFVEKPDAATAAEYLRTGRFFWNAGIFLVRASTLLNEMGEFLSATLDAVTQAIRGASSEGSLVRASAGAFSRAEKVSIDYGIMEKTSRGLVVPVQMKWSDVGAWDAVWKLSDKDSAGNVLRGDVLAIDTTDSLLRNDGNVLIAVVGVEKMAVVAVSDAVLVAPIDRVSEVKKAVESLVSDRRVVAPSKVTQAWGSLETVAANSRFRVEHMVIEPDETMSLPGRVARHLVVLCGAAELTIGARVSVLQADESTHIPADGDARLANCGTVPLEIVAIECGEAGAWDDVRDGSGTTS